MTSIVFLPLTEARVRHPGWRCLILTSLVACAVAACRAPTNGSSAPPDAATPGDPNSAADEAVADPAGDPTVGDPSVGCTDCWRSTLYPEAWTPGFQDAEGRFLSDFSYAGYHNGEMALPDLTTGTFLNVVTDYDADNQGLTDATAAIQQAIDDASVSGGRVLLPAGTYRCDGRLEVRASNVVLRGAGPMSTQIQFTENASVSGTANLTFRGDVTQGTDLPLSVDAPVRATRVSVADASGLSVGDDVSLGWVITDEFVSEHGMTGIWQISNGQWRPIFRRKVVAVDVTSVPQVVTLDVPTRYPAKVRDQASLRRESGYLSECGVEALAVSNAVAWDDAWTNSQVDAITMSGVKDSWIRSVESFPTTDGYHLQSGGIRIEASKRVTIAESRMEKAQNRGGGGNGYLFEVRYSSEILIRDSVGRDGRHNFIQNWDFGLSGCVFLRCESAGGVMLSDKSDAVGTPGFSEYHHSLAMANLVDSCTVRDGWFGGNRLTESTGGGHTTTQGVFWNLSGGGFLVSMQYGWGYVIGPGDMQVVTTMLLPQAVGTAPEDFVERAPGIGPLTPASLYEDQLRRRIGILP